MPQIQAMITSPVRDFFGRHQIVSRLIWLGVAQTALLVAIEISGYLIEISGYLMERFG